MKGDKSLQCLRAGGRCGIGCPTWLCRGPSPAGRHPGGSHTCPYTILLASVVFSGCQSLPGEDWDGRALSRNKKSWVCGGCVETHFSVTAKANSCHRRSFDLRHCGREQSLETQVTQSTFVLFYFIFLTEVPWAGQGGRYTGIHLHLWSLLSREPSGTYLNRFGGGEERRSNPGEECLPWTPWKCPFAKICNSFLYFIC